MPTSVARTRKRCHAACCLGGYVRSAAAARSAQKYMAAVWYRASAATRHAAARAQRVKEIRRAGIELGATGASTRSASAAIPAAGGSEEQMAHTVPSKQGGRTAIKVTIRKA